MSLADADAAHLELLVSDAEAMSEDAGPPMLVRCLEAGHRYNAVLHRLGCPECAAGPATASGTGDRSGDGWPVMPTGWTDAEVAEAFADSIRGRYLWCRELGWFRWDGRRWERDANESVFEEARRWAISLGEAELNADHTDANVLKKVAIYKGKARQDAVVTLARRQHGIAARPEEFDQHPDLIVCTNGVVDLRTGQLGDHDPELLITKMTEVDFDPYAGHPDVDQLLEVLDPPERDWMARLIGYAATGHVDEDVLPVFDGGGSNGKTTVLEAVKEALGDYATTASTRLVMASAHNEHATLEADLFGRRLVAIEETPEGGALRVERIKALTGGGKVKARFIARDQFEFTATHQLVIASNHRPRINSTEFAVWRRLRLVPFPYRYRPADEAGADDRVLDRQLRRRLTGKAQKEAMLAWIVAGAVAWYRDGLGSTAAIDAATEAWRLGEDVLANFIADRLEFTPAASIRGGDLYATYRSWCESEGRPPKSAKNFKVDFLEHPTVIEANVEHARPQNKSTFKGVARRSEVDL